MGNLKERLESGELELPTELEARDDATAALDLVSRIRMALNDNGKRMQDELLIYCRELAALPARVAEMESVRDDLSRAYAVQGLALEEERTRVAELEAELRSIADAKYTTWDDGYNTPQDFVAWVQNRCRFLLKR